MQPPNKESFLRRNRIYILLSIFLAAADAGYLYQASLGYYTPGTNWALIIILGGGTLIYALILWKYPKNKSQPNI